jgi:hypothetical protein
LTAKLWRIEEWNLNETTVKMKTLLETERSNRVLRFLTPSVELPVRWSLLALFGVGVLLSVVLGLVQKWLSVQQLDYAGIFWTLLWVKWVSFGVASVVSVLSLSNTRRFMARRIDLLDARTNAHNNLQVTGTQWLFEPECTRAERLRYSETLQETSESK